MNRGAICGGLLLPPLDPMRSRWIRRLRLPNPAYVAWLKHHKGPEPAREVHPIGRQDGGPWNGGATVPRYAPGVEGVDRTTAPKAARLDFDGTLRDYQREAVEAATSAGHGVIVAPTGAGKTVIGCAIISEHETAALILVHSRDLADQWVERVERFCGVRPEVLGYGKTPSEDARVVVASLQTLARWKWWDVHQWGERFGVVIQDEAHHAPARTYLAVLSGLRGRYRYGLTATPNRADGLTPWMRWSLGPTVYEVDSRRLEAAGAVLRPQIQTWRAPNVPLHGMDPHARGRKLAEDESRNDGLVIQCRILCNRGHVVLVLVKLVDHARRLAEMLREGGLDAAAMVGAMRSKERAEVLDRMRAGTVQVVVATSLADEGLDAPRLSAVVLAAPTRNIGRTLQRIGRALRPCEGAPAPVVVDVVDSFGPFQGYARRRRTVYRSRGWLDAESAAR